MRNEKAFLLMVIAATGLVAATAVRADDDDHRFPRTCTANGWTINVTAGPCAVADPNNPACGTGQFTGIQYQVINTAGTSAPDLVVSLATANNTIVVPAASQQFAACAGEPTTKLGRYSCHEKAFTTSLDATRHFWLVVEGDQSPVETSIVLKKGYTVNNFGIEGLGLAPPVAQVSPVTEVLVEGVCTGLFTRDRLTGAFLSAKLTPESLDAGCQSPGLQPDGTILGVPVETFEMFQDGRSLGMGVFGDGYWHSGDSSCTCKLIGGNVMCFGTTCPPKKP